MKTFDIIVKSKYSVFRGMRGIAVHYKNKELTGYLVEIVDPETGKTHSDMYFSPDELEFL